MDQLPGGSIWRWLIPGLRVKRWLGLLLMGLFFLSLGVSFIYVQLYRAVELPQAISPLGYIITLQFIPHIWRGLILGALGLGLVAFAVLKVIRSIVEAVHSPKEGRIIDMLYAHRLESAGPQVVAVGGGTGLSALLSGMKARTKALTAVVTMADDGGSSGKLRRALGVPPPGDVRHCITALADEGSLLRQLFEYRFGGDTGLGGHNFGNLFIVAMSEITGNFERAVAESSEVLAVHGRILPSTLANVTLSAELAEAANGAAVVRGESAITDAGGPIERVYLLPESAPGFGEAVHAILQAEIIVIGPGSLYTSIMPNLLVRDICEAIRASAALKIYVCNVATQPGETDHYDIGDHIQAIEKHVGAGLVDCVVGNNNLSRPLPATSSSQLVQPTYAGYAGKVILSDVVSQENPWRHDPAKLAQVIMDLYASRPKQPEAPLARSSTR